MLFAWADPASLPCREWLYGGHYIRRFLSVTVAPGGVGKSSLAIAEALAMTSGRALLGVVPHSRHRVWLWNGEDPQEELQRRVMAAMKHYCLEPRDVEGGLFIDSGRSMPIIVAHQMRDGVTIAVPVVDALVETIRSNRVDVLIVDPFVASHRVSENDNMAIEAVAKTWARIADQTGCAVELVHHARKTGGAEIGIEDSRGAVALLSAARSARVLNPMSKEEAEKAGVDRPRLHFRVDNGKSNMAPPPEGSAWHRLEGVPLGNGPGGTDGDNVAVATAWKWPDPLASVSVEDLRRVQRAVADGRWRENIQAKTWVGHAVARALGLDIGNAAAKAQVKGLIKIWLASGALAVVDGRDENREVRTYVEVGEWATD